MKLAVIGGGVGGMAAALLLSRKGYDVTIYEKAEKLGGRLDFVEKDGYRIDKGPTIVLLPQMLREILFEAGISEEELPLAPCDPLYKLNYPDGSYFYKSSNLADQLKEITRMFPGEERNFIRYLSDMENRFIQGKKAFLDRDFVDKKNFWSIKNISTLMRLKAYQNVHQNAAAYFRHPKLQQAFSFQTLYIGGGPLSSPALYSLIPYSEHAHGIWYLKGGYASLVTTLERHLENRRVVVKKGKNVERILTSGNRCTGIQVDGESNTFDAVIYNGDFPGIHQLLGDTDRKTEKEYTPSSGCLLLYFGLSKKYEEADVHQFFMTDDFEKHMNQVFEEKSIPDDPAIYTFYPSKIDESLAPEGKSVLYTLVPVPSGDHINWSEQSGLVEYVIDQIEERGFPGLREAIEWMEIRTPEDARQEGLYQGGSFGIAPVLSQSGVFRPQLKPFPYDGLYSVGASIHPGGGIPIVLQGAKLLADHMEKVNV
ncbi:phytoene desaturase family protein [Pseudalkalibacillus caeni]|uniref:Phytoene desaturase n=1 Tax=Exobacillus caeni TaxID=2574798 RepID=A0A5R9F044_9BACL|nr:phytoene desaturase family protein [Pseudalkalibacillus caeni]TLS36069.1 phytoene desaturase [Pseudalkalibacillus caeni]